MQNTDKSSLKEHGLNFESISTKTLRSRNKKDMESALFNIRKITKGEPSKWYDRFSRITYAITTQGWVSVRQNEEIIRQNEEIIRQNEEIIHLLGGTSKPAPDQSLGTGNPGLQDQVFSAEPSSAANNDSRFFS